MHTHPPTNQQTMTSILDKKPLDFQQSLRGIVWDPASVGKTNETFLIRVWKSFPSRCALKPWDWVTSQNEQYLLAMSLDGYKWYHASKDSKPQVSGLWDLTLVREGNGIYREFKCTISKYKNYL